MTPVHAHQNTSLEPAKCVLNNLLYSQGRSQGGSLGSEEPPQSEKGPPKGLLECTKRSTRLHKRVQ